MEKAIKSDLKKLSKNVSKTPPKTSQTENNLKGLQESSKNHPQKSPTIPKKAI